MRDRVKRIYRNVADGVDLIVFLNAVDPHLDLSFFYATGITDGLFEGCAAWLSPDGGCDITTSALEEEAAKKSGLPLEVFRTRDEADRLMKDRLKGHRRVGVNSSELTHASFARLSRLAPKTARFVDVSASVTKARLVKDPHEIELIQEACDIASRSFEEVLGSIQAGIKESDIASELVYRMQRHGATGASFRTIVGSGPNSAEPHYTAGPRRLETGDFVVIDFGAQFRMYHSDITRTVVVGRASADQRGIYETVAKAQEAALSKMKPGALGKAVDAAARDIIDGSAYKGRFVHGLGHSIGLAVHDGGSLNTSSDVRLKANMVFTNEPGIYIPGFGGVRIEDDVLIDRTSPRVLTSAPRELREV